MDNPKHPNFVYDCDPYYKEQSLSRGGAERGTPRTVRSPDERISTRYPEEVQKGEELRKDIRNGAVIGAISGGLKSGNALQIIIGGFTGGFSPLFLYIVDDLLDSTERLVDEFSKEIFG